MLEIVGHEVLKAEEVQTATQTAIVRTHHAFLYQLQLSHDPAKKEVRAAVYDYLGQPVPNPDPAIVENCIFEYEGQQVAAPLVNGEAVISFDVTAAGQHTVKTVTPKVENGEVAIVVN